MAAEDRRAAIVAAARSLFACRGYDGAGTADIALAAECSEPLLYRYFPSKHALFIAVLEDAAEQAVARFAQLSAADDDPVTHLRDLIVQLRSDCWLSDTFRIRALAVSRAGDPDIRAALERNLSENHAGLTGVFTEGQRRGSVRPDVDAGAAAWLWLGMTLAISLRHSLEGDAVLDTAPEIAATLFHVLLPSPKEPLP
jgi:AcrR family transcriptional regulator